MALIIGQSQVKYLHEYINHPSIVTLSYSGSRVDQLWSKFEDIVPAFDVCMFLSIFIFWFTACQDNYTHFE